MFLRYLRFLLFPRVSPHQSLIRVNSCPFVVALQIGIAAKEDRAAKPKPEWFEPPISRMTRIKTSQHERPSNQRNRRNLWPGIRATRGDPHGVQRKHEVLSLEYFHVSASLRLGALALNSAN